MRNILLILKITFRSEQWKACWRFSDHVCKDRIVQTKLYLGYDRLGCFTPIFQLYRGSWFYWWRKLEYTEKTTQVTWQTLSHNVVTITPHLELTMLRIRKSGLNSERLVDNVCTDIIVQTKYDLDSVNVIW